MEQGGDIIQSANHLPKRKMKGRCLLVPSLNKSNQKWSVEYGEWAVDKWEENKIMYNSPDLLDIKLLAKFFIFDLWDVTFSERRSCNNQILKNYQLNFTTSWNNINKLGLISFMVPYVNLMFILVP